MSNKPRRQPSSAGSIRRIQRALRELSSQLGRLNEAVGDRVDLRGGDIAVLDALARKGPLSPSELASMLGIHPATLTGVLDRLETGGWVVRRPDPDDRRRIKVTALHDRGGELARLYGPMTRSIAQVCASYTAAELEAIGEFLERTAEAGRRAVDATSPP